VGFVSSADPIQFIVEVVDGKNQHSGIGADVARELADLLGVKARFTVQPWKRAIISLGAGDADAIIGISKTAERKHFTYYPETPIISEEIALLTLTERTHEFTNISDLTDKTCGVARGYSYGPQVDNNESFHRLEVSHPILQLRMLVGKRIDCAIMSKQAYLQLTSKQEFAAETTIAMELEPSLSYIGFSLKHFSQIFPGKIQAIESALKTLEASGRITQIQEQYRPKPD